MTIVYLRFDGVKHGLGVANTGVVALGDTLERQSSNERGTDTGTILGRDNLNGVALALGPVEDLAQGLGATSLEVRVLVEDGTVSADVALGPALLLADGGDTAGGEAGGAGTNQLGQTTAELKLRLGED